MKNIRTRSHVVVGLVAVLLVSTIFYTQAQKKSPSADVKNKQNKLTDLPFDKLTAPLSEQPALSQNKLVNSVLTSTQVPLPRLSLSSQDEIIIQLKDEPLAMRYSSLLKESGVGSISQLNTNTTLKDKVVNDMRIQSAAISNGQASLRNELKSVDGQAQIKESYSKTFNGVVVKGLSAQGVEVLRKKYKISPNLSVHALLDQSTPIIGADSVWVKKDSQGKFLTGEGIKIGILDTGVDYTHPDLGACTPEQFSSGTCSKVIGGYDFVNNDADPNDDNGHGTHVAAIAAGNGTLKGVAPGASIVSYKVLSKYGGGTVTGILAALERSADPNQDGDLSDRLDVINLSLGGSGDPDDPMSQAIDAVASIGVIPVVAAGNSGDKGNRTIDSPGTAREAITVGASDKQDKLASFSSRGPVVWNGKSLVKPDIIAPGVAICSARSTINSLPLYAPKCKDEKHVSLNGTSMATPHIAGSAAILKQQHPEWTSSEVKLNLQIDAKDLALSPTEQGVGRVNLLGVVERNHATLPRAVMEPIAIKAKQPSVVLKGVFYGTKLKSYAIAYTRMPSFSMTIQPNSWKSLEAKAIPSAPERYDFSYNFDITKIADASYIIRTEVIDTSNRKTVTYGFVDVANWEITSPQDADNIRTGTKVSVNIETAPGLQYEKRLSYAAGLQSYNQNWIAISGQDWDTEGIATGYYQLRVQFIHDGITEERILKLNLDSTIRLGWPVTIPADTCADYFVCDYISSWLVDGKIPVGNLESLTADINNDGTKEIITVAAGFPPKLYVYKENGQLLWTKPVGKSENVFQPLLTIGDITGDGKPEIITSNYGGIFPGDPDFRNDVMVFAFDAAGNNVPGWPIYLNKGFSGTPATIADLDNDGKPEIIIDTLSGVNGNRQILIVNGDGTVKKSWIVKQGSLDYAFYNPKVAIYPAVANLDSDSGLEIVLTGPDEDFDPFLATKALIKMYAFNADGTLVSGWPIRVDKTVATWGPVVGDIDNDQKDDVILPAKFLYQVPYALYLPKIYAFGSGGIAKPGFPVTIDTPNLPSFVVTGDITTVSLGNMNSTPGVDIFACSKNIKIFCSIFGANGTVSKSIVSNGVHPLTVGYSSSGSVVGDIDGDKKQDGLITAGAGLHIQTPLSTGSESGGGLFAWNQDGTLLPGFRKNLPLNSYSLPSLGNLVSGKANIVSGLGWGANQIMVWDSNVISSDFQWPMYAHDPERTGRFGKFEDKTPPTIPANVKVENTAVGQQVTWDDSTDNRGLGGYEVRQYKGAALLKTETTIAPTVTFADLITQIDYSYEVRAKDNASPANFSGWSGKVTLRLPDTTAPSLPKNVVITNVSGAVTSSQTITWEASTDANGIAEYEIRQIKGKESVIKTTSALTLTLDNLLSNIEYSYEVRAKDKASPANLSAWTTAVKKKTDVITPPLAPSKLKTTNSVRATVLLKWKDNASDEAGFEVWRGTTPQDMKSIGTVAADKKSALDKTTKVAQTYHFKIRVYKTNGSEKIYSNFSNTVKIKVK